MLYTFDANNYGNTLICLVFARVFSFILFLITKLVVVVVLKDSVFMYNINFFALLQGNHLKEFSQTYLDHIEEYGEVFTIGEYIKNQYTKESE